MTDEALHTVAILLGALGILGLFSKPKADWTMPTRSVRQVLMRHRPHRQPESQQP